MQLGSEWLSLPAWFLIFRVVSVSRNEYKQPVYNKREVERTQQASEGAGPQPRLATVEPSARYAAVPLSPGSDGSPNTCFLNVGCAPGAVLRKSKQQRIKWKDSVQCSLLIA